MCIRDSRIAGAVDGHALPPDGDDAGGVGSGAADIGAGGDGLAALDGDGHGQRVGVQGAVQQTPGVELAAQTGGGQEHRRRSGDARNDTDGDPPAPPFLLGRAGGAGGRFRAFGGILRRLGGRGRGGLPPAAVTPSQQDRQHDGHAHGDGRSQRPPHRCGGDHGEFGAGAACGEGEVAAHGVAGHGLPAAAIVDIEPQV